MPNITEEAAYQALGLEAPAAQPAAEGANGQEPAQPAEIPAEEPVGANAQEPAQPATEPEPVEPEGDDGEGAEPAQPEKQTQTTEERRANAARRRQQEQQRAVDTAVAAALEKQKQQADAEWNSFFAASGLKNTITGEPIRTKAEYEQWQAAYQTQQMQKKLKAGELTPEMMDQLIRQNPVVQQAQQLIEQNEAQKQQETQRRNQERMDSEIAEIGKLNPSIRSVEDLVNLPEEEFSSFKSYVDKGYGFLDAYRLSHMDQIVNQRAQQAAQQALSNSRGKEHLRPSGKSQGTGAVSVPPQILKHYRLFMPNATDAQIQAHYNRNLKK